LVVIAQTEASGSVPSESSSKSKEYEIFYVPLVLVGDELLEILLGDIWFAFVIDIKE
jgi:hypothetical protein